MPRMFGVASMRLTESIRTALRLPVKLSLFRRPLPTTNLGFLNTVMWEGRETQEAPARQYRGAESGSLQADLDD